VFDCFAVSAGEDGSMDSDEASPAFVTCVREMCCGCEACACSISRARSVDGAVLVGRALVVMADLDGDERLAGEAELKGAVTALCGSATRTMP
jgi:hypothetical protein